MSAKKGGSPMAARAGGGLEDDLPESRGLSVQPTALRVVAALAFLIPGGLLLLVGLALLLPWLRRHSAVLGSNAVAPIGAGRSRAESRQPYESEQGEPSEQVVLRGAWAAATGLKRES